MEDPGAGGAVAIASTSSNSAMFPNYILKAVVFARVIAAEAAEKLISSCDCPVSIGLCSASVKLTDE